jgi:MFS family permease
VLLGGLILATLREPARGQMERPGTELELPALGEGLRALAATRSYVYIQLGGSLSVFAGYGVNMWLAAFFQRVHGMELSAVGLRIGLIGLACGLGGSFIGGFASDRLSQRDPRWYLWLPTLTSFLALPFTVLFLLAPTADLSFAFYVPHALIGAMYAGPIYALTQSIVRVRLRALAAAVHLFTVNLIGLGLGPLVVGALNDALRPSMGDGAIRYTMLLAAVAHLGTCALLLVGVRHVRSDLARQAAPVPWAAREEGRT